MQASLPGPIYKERGPGTHCLHIHRISIVTPRQKMGYCNVLPWRPSACTSSVYQALSSRIGPGNEARVMHVARIAAYTQLLAKQKPYNIYFFVSQGRCTALLQLTTYHPNISVTRKGFLPYQACSDVK